MRVVLAVLIMSIASLGCEGGLGGDSGTGTGSGQCVFSNPDPDRTKLDHSQPCTTNEECQYGNCHTSPFVAGATAKFCTKQCSCGTNSTCGDDDNNNNNGKTYTCVKFTNSQPDESIKSICVQQCSTDADCPQGMGYVCTLPTSFTARKICHIPES